MKQQIIFGFILFSFVFCSMIAIAQPVVDQVPTELLARLQGKSTLKAIMKEVDGFYKEENDNGRNKKFGNSEDEKDEDALLQWKRWEWYMSSRLGPNGEFVNINEKMLAAYEQDKISNPTGFASRNGMENFTSNISTGSWSFVGPTNYGTVWGGLPGNGRVDRVVFDPYNSNIIYAGTPGGGLWKTTDGGSTWTALSNFMATMGVSGIVIDRNNTNIIYVLTGEGDAYQPGYFVYDYGYARASVGVLKSTDAGQTWVKTGDLYTGGAYAGYKLVQSPSNSNILLAATNQGLYRTTNAGSTWTQVSAGIYTDVEFNPSNGNTLFAAGYGKYKVSNNAGATLNNATFNFSIAAANRMEIAISANDTTKVYLLCAPITATSCNPVTNPGFYGLYLSANGGKNFTRVRTTPNILGGADNGIDCGNQANYDMGITVSPSNANNVAICGMTIWCSTDGFASNLTHVANYWGGPNENVHPDVHDVEYNPLNGYLYAATDGGLYVSINNGTNWTFISNNLNATQWYHSMGFNNDASHIAGGLQDNGIRNRTIYTSAFNHITSGDGYQVAYDPNNNTRFYSIINNVGNKFGSDGASYLGGFNFGNYFPFIGRHPTTTNTLWVGREDSIFKSTNEGTGFTKQNVGGNRRIVFCPSNPNIIFTANSSKVWRSDDGGTSWTDLTSKPGYPAGSPVITCVAVNPADATQVFISFGGFTAGIKVFYSGNSGESWGNDGADLPNVPANCIVVNSNNSAYVGTDDGIYYQSPSDVSWLPYYNNLPRVPVTDLTIYQTAQLISASTFGRGIWISGLKQACDVDLSISGAANGQQFFQATNNISSTQSISGGAGTTVQYRGGGSVTITPGFEAKSGSEWKAYIAPCDTHGVPIFFARKAGTKDTGNYIFPTPFYLAYDAEAGTHLPYGYMTLAPNNANSNVALTIKKRGHYRIEITNKAGKEIALAWMGNLNPGTINQSLHLPALGKGFYYITLKYENKLAHFLEWKVN
jgi:photosystem II stability/assembly factor-like uncharacterized protein